MDTKLIILIILFISFLYMMNVSSVQSNQLVSTYIDTKETNSTNIGFVKPEHRLLKIFNSISSGTKIKLEGFCEKYIYNKNTIDKTFENQITNIIKELINSINQISKNDYYIKQIENIYALNCDKNQRYFIDFFVYDIRNYYTIRLITDIVIVDSEIYINYFNVQSGSNPTILNKYDIKFNDTGILFDGNMFKENIDKLFDSFYRQSFNVIGIQKTDLDYTNKDLTSVVSMNSIRNMYLPSSLSNSTINELKQKDLSSYVEMYLPANQIDIKSPMFCDKYKIEWDSYGIPNTNDNKDTNCYVNENSTKMKYNDPWNPPGLFNNQRNDITKYDWLLKNHTIGNSL